MDQLLNIIEQLLKKLPTDVIWKILSDYLGTHYIESGKLIRKLSRTIDLSKISLPIVRGKYNYRNYFIVSDNFAWESMVIINKNIRLYFCEDPSNGHICYIYDTLRTTDYSIEKYKITTMIDNSINLPSFTKNQYLPLDDTKKRKKNII
jgi:hypothetical protein